MAGEPGLKQVRCGRCGILILSPIPDISQQGLLDRHGTTCPAVDGDGAGGSRLGQDAAGSSAGQSSS